MSNQSFLKGDGPPSVAIVTTDQDSKSSQFYCLPHSDKLR